MWHCSTRVQVLLQTQKVLLFTVSNMVRLSLSDGFSQVLLLPIHRLAPLIGTNDILGEYVEAVALEVSDIESSN